MHDDIGQPPPMSGIQFAPFCLFPLARGMDAILSRVRLSLRLPRTAAAQVRLRGPLSSRHCSPNAYRARNVETVIDTKPFKPRLNRWRVKTRVQSKVFLRLPGVPRVGDIDVEDQIPTVRGHGARNEHKPMSGQQAVAKRLLTRAWNPRSQPICVRHHIRQNDVNGHGVGDRGGGQYVRNRVEGFEPLVDSDFQNCGGGVNRTVDDSSTRRIPATTI